MAHAVKRKTIGKRVAQFADTKDTPEALAVAEFVLAADANAAMVIEPYAKPFGEVGIGELAVTVAKGRQAVQAGDLKGAEAMLYGQAQALQAMFMNFARRALAQDYQKTLESFLRMALKAQSQCRMTLETLATIKNPPVVFARQANINNGGQQQVNNGVQPPAALATESATVGGGIKSLESASAETVPAPTRGIFSVPAVEHLGSVNKLLLQVSFDPIASRDG